MGIRTWSAGHIGHVRKRQEDACVVRQLDCGDWLLAVADGLGGHPAGDQASETAVRILSVQISGYPGVAPDHYLRQALEEVAAHVLTLSQVPGCEGAATTLDAALLHRTGYVCIAHVGDSRVYRLTGAGEIEQLTMDHEDADGRLLSYLGGGLRRPWVDLLEDQLEPGDHLILCTDGLFLHLSDEEIAREVLESPGNPAQALVSAALGRGGFDNVTAVVARFDAD